MPPAKQAQLPDDRPPKATAGKPGAVSPASQGKRPRGRPPGSGVRSPLKDRLEEQFAMVGVLVCAINESDGLAIIDGAERLANSLDSLAKQKPAVRKALERALTASAYGEVLTAFAAIALPIALNHSMLPQSLAGRVGIVYGSPNGADSQAGQQGTPPVPAERPNVE